MFGRKKTYDIIYSLGYNCSAAGFLNKHYLRVSSGPFDWWMMQSPCADNLERRARLICSRFSNFLKKENLEYLELPKDTPRDPDFAPYLDHDGSDIYMPHDFPIGEPMERNYDRVKAKYDRRIVRFYETIQTSDRVLLVWVCIDDIGCEPETIKRLCSEMCGTFGKTVDFLFFWQDDTLADFQSPRPPYLRTLPLPFHPRSPLAQTSARLFPRKRAEQRFQPRHPRPQHLTPLITLQEVNAKPTLCSMENS